MIVKPEKSGHWYTKTGEPCYEVPNKSKPGTMRRVTLRDARKLNLCPSVTTITSMLAKPGLEAWKIEQAILATLTLPKKKDEPEVDYLKRIVTDYRSISKEAAGLGTRIHKCIQKYHEERTVRVPEYGDKVLGPIMDGYCSWAEEHIGPVIEQERAFCCESYGGRVDMVANVDKKVVEKCFSTEITYDGIALIDFKTQSTIKGRKVNVYPEWGMQLAAYQHGLEEKDDLWNVIISTTEPGRIEIVDWTEKGPAFYDTFKHLLAVWVHLNNYDPRENKNEHQRSVPK